MVDKQKSDAQLCYESLIEPVMDPMEFFSSGEKTKDQQENYLSSLVFKKQFRNSYKARRTCYYKQLKNCIRTMHSRSKSVLGDQETFFIQCLEKLGQKKASLKPLVHGNSEQQQHNHHHHHQHKEQQQQSLRHQLFGVSKDTQVFFETAIDAYTNVYYDSHFDAKIFETLKFIVSSMVDRLEDDSEKEKLFRLLFRYTMTSDSKNFQNHFLNFLVYGSPGTGKTTFSKCLKQLADLLFFFVTDPSPESDTVWSMENIQTHGVGNLFYSSMGGCCIFDEAYVILNMNNNDDNTQETKSGNLDSLVRLHEEFSCYSSLIYVMYNDDQKRKMIDTNAGLGRRFLEQFFIPDLSLQKVLSLLFEELEKSNVHLDPNSEEQLREACQCLFAFGGFKNKNFSLVRQITPDIVSAAKANAIMRIGTAEPDNVYKVTTKQIFQIMDPYIRVAKANSVIVQ
jgi:hypothetical protein